MHVSCACGVRMSASNLYNVCVKALLVTFPVPPFHKCILRRLQTSSHLIRLLRAHELTEIHRGPSAKISKATIRNLFSNRAWMQLCSAENRLERNEEDGNEPQDGGAVAVAWIKHIAKALSKAGLQLSILDERKLLIARVSHRMARCSSDMGVWGLLR